MSLRRRCPSALLCAQLVASAALLSVPACSSPDPERVASSGSATAPINPPDPSSFTLPPSDAASRAQLLAPYAFVDPQGLVTRGLLEDALEYFALNKALVPNPAYMAVVDFSKFSGDYRFFLVDMATGAVELHKVAHGEGSDPDDTGYATIFSNTPGSYMSSLGFYMAADIYDGSHPNSMHIYGLSPDGSPGSMADTNVLARAVVVHPADYVSDSNAGAQGRSDGCFALDPNIELGVVQRLTNGALMYAERAPLNPPLGRVLADGGIADAGAPDATGWEDAGYGSCTTSAGAAGVCVTTGTCAAHGGASASGDCPGPDDVQCCTGFSAGTVGGTGWEDGGYGTCTTSSGASGTCVDTATCAAHGGSSTSGDCPGPDDVECCTGF
jgi:hypothetical protein